MPFRPWAFPNCEHRRVQRKRANRTGSSLFHHNLHLSFEKITNLPVMNWNLWIRKWALIVHSVDLSFATDFSNCYHGVFFFCFFFFFFFFLEESGVGILHLEKLLMLVSILITSSHDLACSINFNSLFLKGGFDNQA